MVTEDRYGKILISSHFEEKNVRNCTQILPVKQKQGVLQQLINFEIMGKKS
jgi:hypothetical protein